MSKPEDSDSPPLIYKETAKLLDSMKSNEKQIQEMKSLLEQKQTYYEKLQQHYDNANRSIAEKKASLAIVNNMASLVDTKNAHYRNKAQKFGNSCDAAYKEINEIENSFGGCLDKIDEMNEKRDQKNSKYEEKIEELIKLLNQLTEKRKKKLDDIALQEEELRKQNTELNYQTIILEKVEEFMVDESDDSNLAELENEFKNLQDKLNVLNVDYFQLSEEDKVCKAASEDIDKKFDESIFHELETKCSEINKETPDLLQKMEQQKHIEQDATLSSETLDDYAKKLNEEFSQTAKFWEDLEQNQYGGFSKLEQEIGQIKADIIERNGKYGDVQKEKLKNIQCLKKSTEEIDELTPLVEQSITELKEVENYLEALKSSDDLSQHYNAITSKIGDLKNEKISLEKMALEKEDAIKQFTVQLKEEKEKEDLEISTLQNDNLMEIKNLKKQYEPVEATKDKKENEAKLSETRVNELERTKATLKEKSETLEKNNKNLEETILSRKTLKPINAQLKKDEAKSFAAPKPIYVKNSLPKIPATPKKVLKKTPPKPTKNFDSDSSVEGEVLFTDFLKRKYKRRQDSGK